jgi:hypothetical protein
LTEFILKKDLQSSEGLSEGGKSAFCVRTFGGHYISLDPIEIPDSAISARDLANHLTKIVYFPEAEGGHFSAAQYACELAAIVRRDGPLMQLHVLLTNAHEAFLGYLPPVARAAERAMRGDRGAFDWRGCLEEQVRSRILTALAVPNFGQLQGKATNAILWAREQLDVTLERDIGAFIYRDREPMAPPLPRIIKPMTPWLKPADKYLQLYRDLTALCGLPAKE